MRIGYTGKLPGYGDFLQGGGALEACKTWSAWAESGLAATRDTAGFHDTFLTSPIWRFAVAGGVFGNAPVAGAFCPSMDKVGRLFPFAVMSELEPGVAPIPACLAQGDWFDRLEATILAALDPEARVEDLAASLPDPAMMNGHASASPLSGLSDFAELPVSPEGEPLTGADDLDLSESPSDDADGAWITLGGIDSDAVGIVQRGAATNALFARLVTGIGAQDD